MERVWRIKLILSVKKAMSALRYGGNYCQRPYQPGDTPPTGFEILVDVKGIPSEEISVNVNGNTIFVDVDYVQRLPGWPVKYLKRTIHKNFQIPPGFNPANTISGITPEGVLSIRCSAIGFEGQRQIPMNHHCGYRGEF